MASRSSGWFGELREELLIVLGTSSSESVLPRLMDKLEKMGCQRSVVGLVVPSGYSFNLDGTCIYLTMAAVFLAQATDTPMTLGQQLLMLAVLLLTSQRRSGRDGQRFHRAGRHTGRGGWSAAGLAGADPGHRPLHVRSARTDQSRRQRAGDAGGVAMDGRVEGSGI